MKPLLVALGHQKYVGKDKFVTFCIDILRARTRGVKIMRRGFADKIYEACHSFYGWAGFQAKVYYDEHPERKKDLLSTNKTVRETLIEVGQHLRKIDDDIWVNAALRSTDSDIIFLTDLRFPTEFLHCQANDAILIHMMRPGLPEPTDEADTALNGWDDKWTLSVTNDGDLNQLYKTAELFCNSYLDRFYR